MKFFLLHTTIFLTIVLICSLDFLIAKSALLFLLCTGIVVTLLFICRYTLTKRDIVRLLTFRGFNRFG